MYLIYKAISPSGKIYVGMTSQALKRRVQRHYGRARSRRYLRSHFQYALLKYGKQMVWEVLESGILDLQTAQGREKHYISLLQTTDHQKGYNCSKGGQVGRPPARESEMRPVLRSDGLVFVSAVQTARAMGAQSDDAVAKAMRRGSPCGGFSFQRISLEDYKARVQTVPAGVSLAGDWAQSHKHSQESRARISQAKRGKFYRRSVQGESRRLAATSKIVYRSDGQTFPSILEASTSVGANLGQLPYAIGHQRPFAGFLFSFSPVDEQDLKRAQAWVPKRHPGPAKPLYCSDGRSFGSLSQAAEAFGVDRGRLTYCIKAGLAVQGLKFSRVPMSPSVERRNHHGISE